MLSIPLTFGAWYVTLFTIMFVMVCLFLMLVILIQKPRGGGLTGAFGGAGGGAGSVFGSKTGDVLTWFTVVCFALFVVLSMLLTWTAKPGSSSLAPILKAGSTGDTGGDAGGDAKTGASTGGTDTTVLDALQGGKDKSGATAPKTADGAKAVESPKTTETPKAPEPAKTPEVPKTPEEKK